MEDSVNLGFGKLDTANVSLGHLILGNGSIAIKVNLLESLHSTILALEGLADLEDNRCSRGAHNSNEFIEVNLAIVVGITKSKDGNDFLLAKSSRAHLLLADHAVTVPVKLLEALLDLFQVLVGFAQSAHNGGGCRTHDSHKLAHVNFTIVVGVADGKDCLNLGRVEAASARPHLLLADQTVTVLVQDLEHLLGVSEVLHIPGESGNSHASSGAHKADKFLQIDITVLVEVSQHEDGFSLLRVELSTSSNFILAQNTILVDINGKEGLLDVRDVLELSPQPRHNGESRGTHNGDELIEIDGSIVIDVTECKDGFNLSVVELVARGCHLLFAD